MTTSHQGKAIDKGKQHGNINQARNPGVSGGFRRHFIGLDPQRDWSAHLHPRFGHLGVDSAMHCHGGPKYGALGRVRKRG